jgi:plasmid stabilization system protein ParE
LRDVARLHDFLASKNRMAARRAVRAIRKGVKALGRYPEIGRLVEDLPAEFREWFMSLVTAAMWHSIATKQNWSRF